MSQKQLLLEKGFFLSDEAFARHGSELNFNSALNLDLKEIGAPFFPSEVERRSQKIESLANPHQIILQVKSIKNASSPKIEESKSGVPRLLRISLTDGHSVMHAVELSSLDNISCDTPPGTKVRLLDPHIKILSGFIVLKKGSLKVLGGSVERLIETWENSRKFSSFKRESNVSSGPPPWVPFGKKMVVDASLYEKASKSLEDSKIGVEEKACGGEHSEFNSQRQGAIEEAARLGQKKVFGGGKQEIKDGKRALTKREEIQQRRKGRRGNKENEGESAKPPPSFGLSLSEFIPQKGPSLPPQEEEDEFEPIPPELQAQFDLEAKMQEACKLESVNKSSNQHYGSNSNNNHQYNSRSGEFPSSRNQRSNGQNGHPNGRHNNRRNDTTDRRDRRGGDRSSQTTQQPPAHPSKHLEAHRRQPRAPPRDSQKYENSDQDFGEWTNSTYTETQGHPRKHYGETRTFSAKRAGGPSSKTPSTTNNGHQKTSNQWKANDVVLARYWEDGEYYPVTIKAVSDTTAVVHFEGYGNCEEVLFRDLRPIETKRTKPVLQDQRSHHRR